jgi:hypothetical protein
MSASLSPFWASGSLNTYNPEELKALIDRFTVKLIATPRVAFRTCAANETLDCVVERHRLDSFDFLPVTETKNDLPATGTKNESSNSHQIIGLLEIARFLDRSVDLSALVHDEMRPLSEENLIGADAGIIDFIRDADRQRCRLVISGRDISGLVSLSDLQRLPVRAALFTMVTHLEILMADSIRRKHAQPNEWLELLSEERRQKLLDEIERSRKADAFINELLFTQFSDKVTIIKKRVVISSKRTQFKRELGRVRALRNA